MTQKEFENILENHLDPFLDKTIEQSRLTHNKEKFVIESNRKLKEILISFSFDEETYQDLYENYMDKIKIGIEKYVS